MSDEDKTPELKETLELLREISKATNMSFGETKLFYHAFCEKLLHHFAREGKSLDMGFAVIHATPYRHSWKSYFHQKFPWLASALRRRDKKAQDELFMGLGGRGWDALLMSPILLACRKGVCYFNLELIPRRKWWVATLWHQRRILKQIGPVKYCSRISSTMARVRGRMRDAYRTYLAQTAIPCADVGRHRFYGRGAYLYASTPPKHIKPDPKGDPGVLYAPSRTNHMEPQGYRGDIQETDKVVPEVPDTGPGGEDLRGYRQ